MTGVQTCALPIFLGYMEHQLGTVEPELNRDELKEVFLGIYANPVVAKEELQ